MCFLNCLVLCSLVVTSMGQIDPIEQYRIDTLMENLRMCTNTPGMQLGIVRNGVKAYIGSYGVRDSNSQPVNFETVWPWASLSKAFTGVLLADIVENNASITWETKLKSIMPELEFSDPVRTAEASIKDLLAHRMATPGYSGGWLLYTGGDGMTRDEMPSKMKYFESEQPFRGEFHYNNWMYTLAGHVAERITGKSWETLIRESVYTPLQMYSGTFSQDLNPSGNVAKSFARNGQGQLVEMCMEPLETFQFQGPGGGMAGSTDDMNMWMAYHVNRGLLPDGSTPIPEVGLLQTYGGQMAIPPPVPTMYKPYAPREWAMTSYGFGWFQTSYNGYRVIHHTGGVLGYNLFLTIWPDVGMGIFTASNVPLGLPHQIAHMFISDLLNPAEMPWIDEFNPCGSLESTNLTAWNLDWSAWPDRTDGGTGQHHNRVSVSPVLPLNTYIGDYFHGFFGQATISQQGNNLMLAQGKYGRLTLYPTGTPNIYQADDTSCLAVSRPPDFQQYVIFEDSDNDGTIDAFSVTGLDAYNNVYWRKP